MQFNQQVTGSRGDYRTLQELQQHVHSAIPEQIAVLLLVLIVRGYIDRLMEDPHDLVYVGQSVCRYVICRLLNIYLAQCVQE